MGSPTWPVSRKKADFLSSHQLPIASQSVVGLHELLPLSCWGFGWLDLVPGLCMCAAILSCHVMSWYLRPQLLLSLCPFFCDDSWPCIPEVADLIFLFNAFFLNLLFQNSFFLHGWNSVATDSNSSIISSPATDILLSAAMSLIYLFVYSLQTRTLHAVCKHTATVLQSPLSLAPLDISRKCDHSTQASSIYVKAHPQRSSPW